MEIRLCADCGHWTERGKTRCGRCGGAITLADEQALLGQELGRYRLRSVIGCGGMGIVFAAEHLGLGREVAIKALLPELDHADMVERFQREARMLATLRHPHIIEIFDFDISAQGMPFYVMERLHGMSFGQALSRIGRPLQLPELAQVMISVARALDYAHRHQIIHRDLKPENIYLAHGELGTVVKLLDFGIAKRLSRDAQQSRLTETGAVLGTPLYLSPEQLADEALGPACDQFALALMFAECLLGEPVRGQQSPTQMLRLAMQGEVLSSAQWQQIPERCRAALQRALAFEPEARFPSCTMWVEALELEREPADTRWIESLGLGESRALPTPAPATTAVDAPVRTTPVTRAPAQARALSPTTPVPSATPARSLTDATSTRAPALTRRYGYGWLGLAALVLVLAGWLWRWQAPSAAAAFEWPPGPVAFQPGTSWPLPADVGELLGLSETQAYFGSPNGYYVQALDGSVPISQVQSNLSVIGIGERNELFVRTATEIEARSERGEQVRSLAELPSQASWVRVDREGRWLAYVANDALHWFATETPTKRFSHALNRASVQYLAVRNGQLAAALARPNALLVLNLADGKILFEQGTEITRVFDLAWLPERGRLAVCGFSPTVEIHHYDQPRSPLRVTVPTRCDSVIFVPEGPALLIRAGRSLVRWTESATSQIPWPGRSVEAGGLLARFIERDGRYWLYEPDLHRLDQIELGPTQLPTLNAPVGIEPWDLAVAADGIYVGLSDGRLLALQGDQARLFKVHEAGITDLIDAGDSLASASDDRTLAVWKKPDMSIAWRSRGHAFLVNQLWLASDRQSLWSSSSDGLAKQWRWPDLEPIQELDLRKLCSVPHMSLHAVWFNDAQDRALFGTWNQQLLWLKRSEGTWQCQRLPVDSNGGYRLLGLPTVSAVLLQGTAPSRLYAFDLASETLTRVPDHGFNFLGLSAGPDAQTALAAGLESVLLLRASRDAGNALQWQLQAKMLHGLGRAYAVEWDAPAQRFVFANQRGEIMTMPANAWPALSTEADQAVTTPRPR